MLPTVFPVCRAARPLRLTIRPQRCACMYGHDGTRAAQVAHHLDVHLALQEVAGDVGQRRRHRVAARLGGGVDEDVDAAAEAGDRLRDRAVTCASSVVSATTATTFAPCLAWPARSRSRRGGRRRGRAGPPRRPPGQLARDRLADAAAATGDERALVA
jgi:hypothetical protein